MNNNTISKELLILRKSILSIEWEDEEMIIYILSSEPIEIDEVDYQDYQDIKDWLLNDTSEHYILQWND